jgi:formylglycine-generating enzyme required for sulfatase activity
MRQLGNDSDTTNLQGISSEEADLTDINLKGDPIIIRAQVANILKRGLDEQAQQRITQAYIDWLKVVLSNPDRYTTAELKSADVTLNLLKPPIPQTVPVPAGSFLMGSTDNDPYADRFEKPQHTVELSEYFIGKYPVTNAEYLPFVWDTGRRPPKHWQGQTYPEIKKNHPVVYVSWEDALAYCQWLSKSTGQSYRLPTEAEWEKAARGPDGRIYPWGNQWDAKRCSLFKRGEGGTTPVDAYPTGISMYGLLDTAGNVWEWTQSLWGKGIKEPDFKYPYDPTDGREDLEAKGFRVLRGGSFDGNEKLLRCAFRYWNVPINIHPLIGFRVAMI